MLVLAIVGGAVAAFLLIGLILPSSYRVERSTTVVAPPAAIHPLIASLRDGWTQWDPFQKPGKKLEYAGAAEGAGAVQSWDGGASRLSIVASDPATGISYELSHGSFQTKGAVSLAPAGNGTRVTWTDAGDLNIVLRWMRPVIEKKLGATFERGLANLKAKAEGGARAVAV